MDDIAAMVAEAVARRIKAAADAQKTAASSGGARVNRSRFAPPTIPGPTPQPSINAAKPSVPMGRQPAPAAAAVLAPLAAPALAIDLPDDGLPGLPMTIFGEVEAPRPQLLSTFSGQGLLAGIVLSEALARPVALREGGSGTLF